MLLSYMSQKELNHAWSNTFFRHISTIVVLNPPCNTISSTTGAKACASQ